MRDIDTLIVGSRVYKGREDRRLIFDQAEGWDMLPGEGVDRVVDLENDLAPHEDGIFAHVECVSVLEHARRPWMIATNIERLLCAGGTLLLHVPFVWRVHGYPSDYWRFTVNGVRLLFPRIMWHELRFNTGEGEKIRSTNIAGVPFFARTQVHGFGSRT